jgi:hypothetical protein
VGELLVGLGVIVATGLLLTTLCVRDRDVRPVAGSEGAIRGRVAEPAGRARGAAGIARRGGGSPGSAGRAPAGSRTEHFGAEVA